MEWNMMDPGGSAANGLGCFIEDVYVPADDCEELLDEILESLAREDPKLRNTRTKLSFDKIVEKDLVPLVLCCADEDIISRTVRLLANLTQPLEVFLQLGVPLAPQCQREISNLVSGAKARCTDLEFFKSLHSRMETALVRGEAVDRQDSEMLNHALLLLRNLLHTGPDEANNEATVIQQSMLSSFFLSEMDQLVLRLLAHPQKEEWVVSVVQVLSLVFKDHAGVLLESSPDDLDSDGPSDCDSLSDVLELVPSNTSRFLSHDFRQQLHIADALTRVEEEGKGEGGDFSPSKAKQEGPPGATQHQQSSDMQTDTDNNNGEETVRASSPSSKKSSSLTADEDMSISDDSARKGKKLGSSEGTEHDSGFQSNSKTELGGSLDSVHSGQDDCCLGGDAGRRLCAGSGQERDSCEEECLGMAWENGHDGLAEKKAMSELSSGSCLMDGDIIVAYLKKFGADIIGSGLSNLIKCLMKALMSSYEGVLDDSFFMWTVGFFLSFARHTQVSFDQYSELLNLDVIGFLVYQGFRNCEALTCQMKKQQNCSLIKYRLHLVVCTLNQLFQIILSHAKDSQQDNPYMLMLQKCLAQMGDLRRLLVLLMRCHQPPVQDSVYLRDLVHTTHTYLILLEEWVAQKYLPPKFSMLGLIRQYATGEVMEKYGSLLESYSSNKEALNVAVMTMMYHVAGDCNRGDVLLQLPILKKFSEIWGDVTCTKFVEFNDLIEYTLESFMGMAFKDPVTCAQRLFDLSESNSPSKVNSPPETVSDVGGLSEEEQDLLFTWTTDLQGSVNMVDQLVRQLHDRGSSATRKQVMLHLLRNGWLEEKQLQALSKEIKELNENSNKPKQSQIQAELSLLSQEELLPFLVEKMKSAGYSHQLTWLQDQLLEAAYVRLGVRDSKYRIHVEEPLARFYALQDKSIPLVTVSEEEERLAGEWYFTALLQALGLFPADTSPSCVFCRVPHFLTPAQLLDKARQLGPVHPGMVKFDMAEVEEDLIYTEFTPLFKTPPDNNNGDYSNNSNHKLNLSLTKKTQTHQWLDFVQHINQTKTTALAQA